MGILRVVKQDSNIEPEILSFQELMLCAREYCIFQTQIGAILLV